jgi:complement component 1 Q subcomponent-binding protein
MCQEGAFIIDNMSYYPDAQLGTELTAEADWKRRGLYIGPQFDTLDVSVQEEIEKWLQERGINENLAMFVPEYSEYKEQKVGGYSPVHFLQDLIAFSLRNT